MIMMRQIFTILLFFFTLSTVLLLSFTFYSFLFLDISLELPEEDSLLLDDEGQVIHRLNNRRVVTQDEIPKRLKQAFIAIEDERFYRHWGVDPLGLLRAMIKNLQAKRILQGGSTITQQLAKIAFLSPERTFTRKLHELIIALRLEHMYTKDEILYHYLNHIYLGHGVYGLGEASSFYFDRDVQELSLEEMALLAGITQSPGRYSPLLQPEEAYYRRNLVLEKMEELMMIDPLEAQRARERPVEIPKNQEKSRVAPYFQDYIIEEMKSILGDTPQKTTIYTTLNLTIQREVERAIDTFLMDKENPPQVAVLVLDPHTGGIKAMVGGRDDEESFFNRATMAKRQSGSAFKPITYASALEGGLTAISSFRSTPTLFKTENGSYQPENFNKEYFYRDITLREALQYSDNVVSVKVQEEITVEETLKLAKSLGFTDHLPKTLSLVLGTGEVTPLSMALSYCSFANGGYGVKSYGIKEIKREDEVLYHRSPWKRRVLGEGTAFLITNILEGVINQGTASKIREKAPSFSAGKTGTSQDNRDAWFIGYTPSLLTCVWIGHDYPKDLKKTGGELAAPLWAKIMRGVIEEEGWRVPPGILREEICADTLLLVEESCSKTFEEYFLVGTEPSRSCSRHPQEEKDLFKIKEILEKDSTPSIEKKNREDKRHLFHGEKREEIEVEPIEVEEIDIDMREEEDSIKKIEDKIRSFLQGA